VFSRAFADTDPKEFHLMKFPAIIRRHLSTILLIALAGGAYLWIKRVAPTPAVFDKSVTIQQASRRAEETGHVVLAVVTADFCPTCQAYKRGALNDQRFAQWVADNAEPVYLEWDRDPGIIKAIGVDRWPATVVMDSANHVLGKRYGALSSADLLAFVQLASLPSATTASTTTSTTTSTSTVNSKASSVSATVSAAVAHAPG